MSAVIFNRNEGVIPIGPRVFRPGIILSSAGMKVTQRNGAWCANEAESSCIIDKSGAYDIVDEFFDIGFKGLDFVDIAEFYGESFKLGAVHKNKYTPSPPGARQLVRV